MAKQLSVLEMAREILDREGGYVDDPDDPGGATKHGVTIGTMRRLGLDLNGDGLVDARDVRQLSRAQAEQIFLQHYFHAPRIPMLPQKLQASAFDMYVNAGSQSVRILQKLLCQMGYDVRVDGRIGPITARASHNAADVETQAFVDAYGIARRCYYLDLADRRPSLRKYARRRTGGKGGWIKRAEEFISPGYHLSAEKFAARTAHWAFTEAESTS